MSLRAVVVRSEGSFTLAGAECWMEGGPGHSPALRVAEGAGSEEVSCQGIL